MRAPRRVEGLDELNPRERLRLLTTCSALLIEEAVWLLAGLNRQKAKEGIDQLMQDIKQHFNDRRRKSAFSRD